LVEEVHLVVDKLVVVKIVDILEEDIVDFLVIVHNHSFLVLKDQ